MSMEKEFVKKSLLIYLSNRDTGRIVGVFHFDEEYFGKNINDRIGDIISPESRLCEILSTTTDDEFLEMKRLGKIKYHNQEIRRLENKINKQ